MSIVFEFKSCYNIYDLIEIIRILREPGGCPWDAEQTHESIKKNLIEETYEVIEAINKADNSLLCEELGDLMMQVIFHAQMETEIGSFNINDVSNGVCKKLIERHPHVFGEVNVSGVSDVLTNWEVIKRRSKGQSNRSQAMLSIPKELPALMRGYKVQQKAASVGFDWPDISGAIEKLDEEILELKESIIGGSEEETLEELGDVLFSIVNVSRFVGFDAEEALTLATNKFIRRFTKVEQLAEEEKLDLQSASLEKLNFLWDIAKQEKE
ncbi:MAG: nucleoside triphosphate pyrophosphohydrolase [Eubacteriales bacterium]